jgi:death-on-curing protein
VATTYLDLEDVLHMHAVQIERFGGSPGVRDAGLIEAALLRPQTGYYSDLIEESAAMWESLTMNHGFVDGNKRIGLAATYTFLALNGVRMTAGPDGLLLFIMSNLEAGTFNKDNLDAWLRANTKAG